MLLRRMSGTKSKNWVWVKSFCVVSMHACIQLIRRNPEMYQVAHATYRRAVVRRFPYVVFYELSDITVTVYAVFHCSQDPKKWRGRLP